MLRITQRQIALTLMIAFSVLTLLIAPLLFVSYGAALGALAFTSGLIISTLSFAYWRGWEPARSITAMVLLAAAIAGIPTDEPFMPLALAIVPLLALVLTGPVWVVIIAIIQLGGLIVRSLIESAGQAAAFTAPVDLLLYTMAITAMVLSRLMVDTALRIAQENARQAATSRDRAEAHAAELAQQAGDLARQNQEQRRLLDLVATLEVPTVALADGVLLAPIVGAIDSRRAQDLTSRLLAVVSSQRTAHVILDISGVSVVDTDIARLLIQTIQALRLLGCQVILTGITAPVATSMTSLGIDLAGVQTARSPQDVLTQLI